MSSLATGQKFGRYRIHDYLGSGISSESYEAEDVVLQRSVALKLIHPWAFLPDAARRQFFREMQDISTFEHPSLAPIHDYGELNSQLFIARRYVDAGSLLSREGRDWYRSPMTLADALQLAYPLAQALAYIHSHNYFHGSLTFSNILVLRGLQQTTSHDPLPLLIADPGLAHFVRRFGQPRTSYFLVTTAPEQLGGRTTPASDQYALAILLYFWLTNRLPFTGSPATVEQHKLSGTIKPLTAVQPAITQEQSNIILRALNVYPEERYTSVLHFIDALRATISSATFLQDKKSISQVSDPSSEPPSLSLPVTPQPERSIIPTTPVPDEASLAALPPPRSESSQAAPRDVAEEVLTSLMQSLLPGQAASQQGTLETRTNGPGSPEQPEALVPYLIITARDLNQLREIKLNGKEITLGRAGSSDVLLDQDTITSRHQALIKYEQENYMLYDRRSAHGTTLNGQKLESEVGYTLHNGDHIGIGIYDLIFVLKEQ